MRLKPPTMFRRSKARSLLTLGVAIAAFAGVGFATTGHAMADPTEQLVVVGSDTIQDVWNAFGTQFSGNLIGSYNATNPVTGAINEIITPADGHSSVSCSFARPNGSSQGVAALRYSLNEASTNLGTNLAAPGPQLGCVDIARSSSGPGSLGNYTGAGAIQYVPFALDAVTGATGPASCTPSTNCPTFNADLGNGSTKSVTTEASNITMADDFTMNDLYELYNQCQAITAGGVTYWPSGSPNAEPSGATVIDLYIPQPGSGTRSFWASTLGGFNATTPPACDHDHIIAGELATANTGGVSVPVEEHDGTAVATDPNGYDPFSIAQYISQGNGHNPRTHGAILHDLTPCTTLTDPTSCATTAVAPVTTGGTLNTAFPITRDVYNVVSLARLTNTSDPLFALLNGTTSEVCSQKGLIVSYGFALIGSQCGEITPANEAQP